MTDKVQNGKSSDEKMILIDGNGLAYRAFYALPPLKTSRGETVNAVYGFTNMLFKIIERERPDYVAVAFDKSGPTKRHEQFDQYKAHRQRMPEELQQQFPIIEEVVKVLKIPVFHLEGYEADDCIASLETAGRERGVFTKIYSGDLDMLQLVCDQTHVVTTRRGISDLVVYDSKMVRKRYGIDPPQLVDYKALAGDSSDHIPGIPGIGEASASKLLNQFKDIETMYEESEEIPSRWKKQIIENQEQAFLSKKLVSLERYLDLGFDWDELRLTEPDREELKKLFVRLEFKSMLKKLGFKEEELTEIQEISVQIVGKDEDLDNMLSRLKSSGKFSIFWINDEDKKLVGLAIAQGTSNGYYFPFILPEQLNITSTFGISTFSQERIFHELKSLIDHKDVTKFVFDLKTGIHHLKRSDYLSGVSTVDLSTATFLLDPENAPKSLEEILSRYSDFHPKTLNEIVSSQKSRKKIRIIEIPLQDLTLFAAARAVRMNNLGPELLDKMKKEGVLDFFNSIEMPTVQIFGSIGHRGVKIDLEALKVEADKIEAEVEEINKSIAEDAGHELNVNSTRQLGKVLFEELKLPGARKTSTGYKTGAEILEKIVDEHPIVSKILKFREVSKLRTLFTDILKNESNPDTGRMQINYVMNSSPTGRVYTNRPNLRTMPKFLRRVFIPSDEERVFMNFDFDQLELRVLAHLSEDKKMIEFFEAGKDVHQETAALLPDLIEDMTPERKRQIAKETAYGIINGLTAHGLNQVIDVGRTNAKKYISAYLEIFEGVNGFIEKTLETAREKESISNVFGRKLNLSGINSRNKGVRSNAEKAALSFLINSTASDLIKNAILKAFEGLLSTHRDIHIVVHHDDKILFEVKKKKFEKYLEKIHGIFESSFELKVPLKVSMSKGLNWLELEKITLPEKVAK